MDILHTPLGCVDIDGKYIKSGKKFQPTSTDHCVQCVCLNGKAESCMTIQCRPPDNCESAVIQKKGSCCEFLCLNPNQEDEEIYSSTNKMKAIKKYSTLESTNTIDNLNELDVNNNLKNNLSKSSSQLNSNLTSLPNEQQQNLRNNFLNIKLTNNTNDDRRYSNIEATLKKLMSNKNLKNYHLNEETKNSTFTKFNDNKYNQRLTNPIFQNTYLGIGVGIGGDSSEVQINSQSKSNKQRINYNSPASNQSTIYSPPNNKYSSTNYLGNEQIRHAGKKYGIYGSTIYHNNLNNNFNQLSNSSQLEDHPLLNEIMRTRQFNRNHYISPHHTSGGNLNLNNNLNWFSTHSLGLRLIASTLCTFLILALLFFLIHRLRQRRISILIRRLQNRRDENNGQHMYSNSLPCFQSDLLGRANCFETQPPPPYFGPNLFWKSNLVPPNEPPPTYQESNNNHAPSFSNPLLNINPIQLDTDQQLNQLSCFNVNSSTSNLLNNGICFNTIDRHNNDIQSNLNNNSNNIEDLNSSNNNYDVPFTNNQLNQTSLKTNQIRTNQPVHFDFMNNNNNLTNIKCFNKNLSLHTTKLKNYLQMKENQMDKLRSMKSHQIPTSTRALANNNELMETQNLNNTIIEDQLFKSSASLLKSNENSLRLFVNNSSNRQLDHHQNNSIHSQSVDNLNTNSNSKSISNHLLDFYNNNLANRSTAGVFNPTYSTIQKSDTKRYNSNLSLKNKYQRCVVNIPNLPTVFKSSLSNQLDYKFEDNVNNFNDNFNGSFDRASNLESPPSPAPPEVPIRKVSLPAELRNENSSINLQRNHSTEQQQSVFTFKDDELKNQTSRSFNHSTPTINLNQFKYNLYLNNLKSENDKEQCEEKQLNQSTTNESLIKASNSFDSTISNTSSIVKLNNQDNFVNNNDIDIRPSTSENTTRIMISYKK